MCISDIALNRDVRHGLCLHSALASAHPISPNFYPELSPDIIHAIVVYANKVLKKKFKYQNYISNPEQLRPFTFLYTVGLGTDCVVINYSKERER